MSFGKGVKMREQNEAPEMHDDLGQMSVVDNISPKELIKTKDSQLQEEIKCVKIKRTKSQRIHFCTMVNLENFPLPVITAPRFCRPRICIYISKRLFCECPQSWFNPASSSRSNCGL
ncbi:unnamed protein product [Moneuplotes crassus]|uniref:Uncharacterized protein n=1 Tax=Euplotes crassus TaxID=5936 RepID=A0AAD1XPD7_EUPCR|nr:unnamed protein product [Moneuplotes crassus]